MTGGHRPAGAVRHRYALLRPGHGVSVSGQLSGLREERRNQRMIDSYSDHFSICRAGRLGRVGRQVARDLSTAGVKHVAGDAVVVAR